MIAFFQSVLRESLSMFVEAAPYMLLGIALGGLLKAFIDPSWVQRVLGGTGLGPVFRASIAGIPLPLCSCGVIPAAAALRKQGASSSATVSFLISTPESGVDSIALSYALLDPILTVVRPVVAFVTAFVAGGLSEIAGGPETAQKESSCGCNCGCGHDHGEAHHDPDPSTDRSIKGRLISGATFAFVDIWGDLAAMFFVGIVLSGIISVVVPQAFLETYLGGGLRSMLVMLVAGIPMYICASSSTPLAAALILKGVSPGAALVFLMAGPATNVSALPVLRKILGNRRLALYLGAIAVVSVLSGLTVDWIYQTLGISAQATVGQGTEALPSWVHVTSAIVLLGSWLGLLVRTKILRPRGSLRPGEN